jgi:hypothetical protein
MEHKKTFADVMLDFSEKQEAAHKNILKAVTNGSYSDLERYFKEYEDKYFIRDFYPEKGAEGLPAYTHIFVVAAHFLKKGIEDDKPLLEVKARLKILTLFAQGPLVNFSDDNAQDFIKIMEEVIKIMSYNLNDELKAFKETLAQSTNEHLQLIHRTLSSSACSCLRPLGIVVAGGAAAALPIVLYYFLEAAAKSGI